jgi:hypothetical protein
MGYGKKALHVDAPLLISLDRMKRKRFFMVRCWQCGNDLEGYNKQDVDRAYDQGYMQAIRDTKNAKIDYAHS